MKCRPSRRSLPVCALNRTFADILAGNQSYWETVEPQPDGSVEVTFSAPTLEWAASTTLAYGPAVEVLEPPELRVMVAEWLEATGRKYKA